jgi:N-acetylglucosaminyldiphosphoundecaprenol N-acetyl-beta-D-mannosaminyltransferase
MIEFRRILNQAFLCTPDGMPLVWMARSSHREMDRVYGPDLMELVCARVRAAAGAFFFGGAEGVAVS